MLKAIVIQRRVEANTTEFENKIVDDRNSFRNSFSIEKIVDKARKVSQQKNTDDGR